MQHPSVALLNPALGQGAYGTVHRGYVRGVPELAALAAQPFAIKSPHSTRDGSAGVPQMQLRELAAMSAIPPHPNLLRLHAAIVEEGRRGTGIHLLLPCARGNARARLKQPRTALQVLQWCSQLASAVAHMHSHGWMHRDIKLENCLMFDDTLVLGDLGLSRMFRAAAGAATGAAAGAVAGVPAESEQRECESILPLTTDVCTETTRAPELFLLEQRGLPTTHEYALSADVWSLGACCLALAVGRYTFRSQPRGARNALQSIWALLGTPADWPLLGFYSPRPPPSDTAQAFEALGSADLTLPRSFWDLLHRMLRIKPWERIGAEEAAAELSALVTAMAASAAPPSGAMDVECAGNAAAMHSPSPRDLSWQPFQVGCRILCPPSVAPSPRPLALSEASFLQCMVECWDACRGLALAPLTAVLAQSVLARALRGVRAAEQVLSKPLGVACALLAAKCIHFSPPSLRSAALTLRVGARAVASSEIDILCALRGDVLGPDFHQALMLWGDVAARSSSSGRSSASSSSAGVQRPQPHLALCIASALRATSPGMRLVDADATAKAIVAGAALPDIESARTLVRACKAGSCLPFFKPWPNGWTDFSSTMRTWAASFSQAADVEPCAPTTRVKEGPQGS